ncbi:MAG: LamG-like jellyroll fold domain-containing protein, partial [Bacteroidota bacterium]
NGCYLALSDQEERQFQTISDFYWTGSDYGYGYEAEQARVEAKAVAENELINADLLTPFDQVQALVYNYSRTSGGNLNPPSINEGGLTYGYGAGGTRYGPELLFGHKMAQSIPEDIVLLKVAEGGSSLHEMWRSPSMVERLGESPVDSNYPLLIEHVTEFIDNPGDHISKYAGQDVVVELAGFIWFQGWNDSAEGTGLFALSYEQNLTDLINDIRTDLDAPDLPVVIGKTQNDGTNGQIVQQAQEAVSQSLNQVRAVTTNDLSNYFHFDSASHLIIGDRMARKMTQLLNGTEVKNKLLVIGIDGCRPDALTVANTPNIDALIENSTYSLEAQTLPPTVSGPGWSAMLTGVWHDKHGVTSNSFASNNYAQYPHFFNRIKDHDPNLNLASIVNWAPINDNIVDRADLETETTDQGVSDEAVDLLLGGDPDAVFLHFDQIDGAGHSYGFGLDVPAYMTAIENVDALVGPVVDAINNRPTIDTENWVIIVSTDHGGIGNSHGGASLEETTIFVIVSGDAVPNQEITPTPNGEVSPAAIRINSPNTYATVADSEDFNFGADQDFTIECWVKSTGWGSDPAIISDKDWNNGFNSGFVIAGRADGEGWKANIGDGSNRIDLDGGIINDNQWHQLTLSCDRDGYAVLYQDGVRVSAASMAGLGDIHSSLPIGIGQDGTLSYNAFFNGQIDEVRIWEVALDEATVEDWACQTIDGNHPNYSFLIGHWVFDGGSGSEDQDLAGGDHDATIVNPRWIEPGSIFSCTDFTPSIEIVDVAYTALQHLCIPINPNWELDGKAIGVPPCDDCCDTDPGADNLVLHMPRLIGDEDVVGVGNVIDITTIDPEVEEDHIYTGIKNKDITIDLVNSVPSNQATISFKFIPDELTGTHTLLNNDVLNVSLSESEVISEVEGVTLSSSAPISNITCNHVVLVLDNGTFRNYVNGYWSSATETVSTTAELAELVLEHFPGRIFDVQIYDKVLSNSEVSFLSQYCLTNKQVNDPPFAEFPYPTCAAYVCLFGGESDDMTEEKFQYYVTQQELAYETFVFDVGMYPHGQLDSFVNAREDRNLGMYSGIQASFVNGWSFSNPHQRGNANYWFHENFHSFQSNCGNPAAKWILESTAEWGPDRIFPGATSTLLGYYSLHPHLPIWTNQSSPVDDYAGSEFKGGHQYGAYVFWSYLTNFITDNRIIGNLFNDARVSPQPMKVVEELLAAESHDLREVFADFAAHASVWDYYDDTSPYFIDSEMRSLDRMMGAVPDADYFDYKFTNIMDEQGTAGNWTSIPEEVVPGSWAYNAYKVITGTEAQEYLVKLKGDNANPGHSRLRARVVVKSQDDFLYYDLPISQDVTLGNGETSIVVPTLPGDELSLIVSTTPDVFTHEFDHHYQYEYSIGVNPITSTNDVNQEASRIRVYAASTLNDYVLDLGQDYDDVNMTVFDAVGRKMAQYEFGYGSTFDFRLDGVTGIYFIWVELEDRTYTTKLYKQ